jgi:hypothetical protein
MRFGVGTSKAPCGSTFPGPSPMTSSDNLRSPVSAAVLVVILCMEDLWFRTEGKRRSSAIVEECVPAILGGRVLLGAAQRMRQVRVHSKVERKELAGGELTVCCGWGRYV